jgi:hypothetical protein
MLAGYDGGGTDIMGGIFVDTNRIFFRVAATERVRYGGRRLTSSRDLLRSPESSLKSSGGVDSTGVGPSGHRNFTSLVSIPDSFRPGDPSTEVI